MQKSVCLYVHDYRYPIMRASALPIPSPLANHPRRGSAQESAAIWAGGWQLRVTDDAQIGFLPPVIWKGSGMYREQGVTPLRVVNPPRSAWCPRSLRSGGCIPGSLMRDEGCSMSETNKKRRYGPSPLLPEKVRGRRVSVYLSDAERELLTGRAAQIGLRLPAYIRDAALDRLPPMIPALNREAWVALSRAAGNLNQIARAVRGGGAAQAPEVRAALNEFRGALIGAQEVEDEGES